MEIFKEAAVVRLRSHREKYLVADEDQESVHQDRRGTSKNSRWTVEIVPDSKLIRLQSRYGKYLTASNSPFLLGATGNKVLQTLPEKLDSSIEWEPISDVNGQVKFKTCYGQYLRANRGLPPWRNSITHDIPHRTATQDWIWWDVDVLQIRNVEEDEDSTHTSPRFSRIESDDSYDVSLPLKSGGRLIYYEVGDEDGIVDEIRGKKSFTFIGSELKELKQKLEEETRMKDIRVCSRSPLNGKLCPLQLHLPPNNTAMHIILIPSSSKEIGTASPPKRNSYI